MRPQETASRFQALLRGGRAPSEHTGKRGAHVAQADARPPCPEARNPSSVSALSPRLHGAGPTSSGAVIASGWIFSLLEGNLICGASSCAQVLKARGTGLRARARDSQLARAPGPRRPRGASRTRSRPTAYEPASPRTMAIVRGLAPCHFVRNAVRSPRMYVANTFLTERKADCWHEKPKRRRYRFRDGKPYSRSLDGRSNSSCLTGSPGSPQGTHAQPQTWAPQCPQPCTWPRHARSPKPKTERS